MLRTLYGRLAAALFALFAVVAVLYLGIVLFSTRLYVEESNQRLHRDLAQGLVSEGLIGEGGEVGQRELESVFHTLMVVNPSIEVYLLDPEGRILRFSAPPGRVRADRVSLGPVRRFLRDPDRVPILGDDPRHPGQRKVFSAAPVPGPEGRVRGYLYVILAGEPYESAFQFLRRSYITRLSVGLVVVGLGFVLAAGLLFFHFLTRRLRRLTLAVKDFPAASPSRPGGRGDEIQRLELAFREMSERIREQVEGLRGADAQRRTLLTHISHDLRTPLSSLQGHLETLLLKEDSLGPGERRHSLEVALSSSRRLGRLVADLFELAKLDSPETRVEAEPFPLPELARDVAQKLQAAAEEKGVRIEVTPSEDLPLVRADIGLAERALENLIQNAVRYSHPGEAVAVSFRADEGMVEVQVSDRGPGIDPLDLPHLFERFYQDRRSSAARAGSGLGLAIVKRISELHGGSARAENREGGGAAFLLTLPVNPPPA